MENLNVEGAAQLLTAGIHNEVFPLFETYAETGYLQDEVEKAFANNKDRIQKYFFKSPPDYRSAIL